MSNASFFDFDSSENNKINLPSHALANATLNVTSKPDQIAYIETKAVLTDQEANVGLEAPSTKSKATAHMALPGSMDTPKQSRIPADSRMSKSGSISTYSTASGASAASVASSISAGSAASPTTVKVPDSKTKRVSLDPDKCERVFTIEARRKCPYGCKTTCNLGVFKSVRRVKANDVFVPVYIWAHRCSECNSFHQVEDHGKPDVYKPFRFDSSEPTRPRTVCEVIQFVKEYFADVRFFGQFQKNAN